MVQATETLLVGNKRVDSAMAIATQGNGLRQLLAREAFAKPFVAMTTARNEMVLCGPLAHGALTQLTAGVRARDRHVIRFFRYAAAYHRARTRSLDSRADASV